MYAVWNITKRAYEITMTEHELGVNIFALTVAKYETHDAAVATLQKEFLNLNNAGKLEN
ncbi:MAG: hypothetical protein HMLIMOIP_002071 [Candidatus Nitrosomirales archaeon]|jgi:hypothetical protein